MFDGAYYLAGYAVECGIKACIAKRTQRGEFPDKKRAESSHSHNLWVLIRVADLDRACQEKAAVDPEFGANWRTVQSWSELSRYRRNHRESAETLLGAVGDRRHGVITWIRRQW